MTNLEKIFIALFLFSFLVTLIIRNFQVDLGFDNSILHLATPIFALVLNIYYLTKLKFSFHWILILCMISGWTGMIFKIFHFLGADLLFVFSYLLAPIIGITLLRTGLKTMKKIGVKSIYNVIVGMILLIQFILPMINNSSDDNFKLISHYLLIATVLTMKLKKDEIKRSESHLMTLLIFPSIIYVLTKLVI